MKRCGGNKCILLDGKSKNEKAAYCMISNILTSGKGKATDSQRVSSYQEQEKGRMNRCNTGDFQGSEMIL